MDLRGRRPGAAWSCRRRWARGPPSARPPRRSRRPRSSRVACPRRTVTSANSRTAAMRGHPIQTGIRGPRRSIAGRERQLLPGLRAARLVGHRVAARTRRRPTSSSTRSSTTTRRTPWPACDAAGATDTLVVALGRLRAAGADGVRRRAARPRATRSGSAAPGDFNAAALEAGEAVVVAGAGRRAGAAAGRGRDRPGRRTPPSADSCPTSARRTGPCARRCWRPPTRWPASTSPAGAPRSPTS